MNNLLKTAGLVGCLAVAGSLFVPLSIGQTPPAKGPAKPAATAAAPAKPAAVALPQYTEQELMALITEVAAQQNQLKVNQEAMEAKIAVIQEDVRQARIFAARTGGRVP